MGSDAVMVVEVRTSADLLKALVRGAEKITVRDAELAKWVLTVMAIKYAVLVVALTAIVAALVVALAAPPTAPGAAIGLGGATLLLGPTAALYVFRLVRGMATGSTATGATAKARIAQDALTRLRKNYRVAAKGHGFVVLHRT